MQFKYKNSIWFEVFSFCKCYNIMQSSYFFFNQRKITRINVTQIKIGDVPNWWIKNIFLWNVFLLKLILCFRPLTFSRSTTKRLSEFSIISIYGISLVKHNISRYWTTTIKTKTKSLKTKVDHGYLLQYVTYNHNNEMLCAILFSLKLEISTILFNVIF